MDKRLFVIFLISLIILDVTSANKKRYGMIDGVFCAAQSLRQTAVFDSGLQCTRECHNDAKCVAFSQQNSTCILHNSFCSMENLRVQLEAMYVGKFCALSSWRSVDQLPLLLLH